MADAQSADVESHFDDLTLDAALSGTPFLGLGSSAQASASYSSGYRVLPLGYRQITYSTTGNYSLDLQNSGHDSVFLRAEVTATSVVINSITKGAFQGQRLIINNRNTSTQNLTIANSSGGLILVGTSLVLTPKQGCTLVWDGSNWRSAIQN